jgi:hypothetical protein
VLVGQRGCCCVPPSLSGFGSRSSFPAVQCHTLAAIRHSTQHSAPAHSRRRTAAPAALHAAPARHVRVAAAPIAWRPGPRSGSKQAGEVGRLVKQEGKEAHRELKVSSQAGRQGCKDAGRQAGRRPASARSQTGGATSKRIAAANCTLRCPRADKMAASAICAAAWTHL